MLANLTFIINLLPNTTALFKFYNKAP